MPKEGARPLLILWPFGPVALVYDEMDTEGKDLPEDVASFFAHGPIEEEHLASFKRLMKQKGIEWYSVDEGDRRAGSIRLISRITKEKEYSQYRMHINQNHTLAVQMVTVAHELGHLCLGHLGPDKRLNVPERPRLTNAQLELEAESVAFLVSARNGVKSKSEAYLTTYVEQNATIDQLDIYQVMRAAGQVESLLGLTIHTRYNKPIRQYPKTISVMSRVVCKIFLEGRDRLCHPSFV